jgi:hypothetical protein
MSGLTSRDAPVCFGGIDQVQQSLKVEGLAQTAIETIHLIPRQGAVCRQREYRCVFQHRLISHAVARFYAVHARHPDVEQHQVWPKLRRYFNRVHTVEGGANIEAFESEVCLNKLAAVLMIVSNHSAWSS